MENANERVKGKMVNDNKINYIDAKKLGSKTKIEINIKISRTVCVI